MPMWIGASSHQISHILVSSSLFFFSSSYYSSSYSSSFFFLLGLCLKCGYGMAESPKQDKEIRFELFDSEVQIADVVSFGLRAFSPPALA